MGIGNTLQVSVARLLKPLVRMLLRNGVTFGVFLDISKRLFAEVAMEDFKIPGRAPSKSRASVITGLSRKEINRVLSLPQVSDEEIQERHNRAVRVVTGWIRDEAFTDAEGKPKALLVEGEEGSFSHLVKKYSGDVPVRAILDELVRVGTVERLGWREVGLRKPAYIPAVGEEEKIGILGVDVSDLISTIDYNMKMKGQDSRFHLKVSYDNLPGDSLGRFRSLSSEKALKLLKELDKELSGVDRDVNPAVEGEGRFRGGISIYYFEEDLQVDGKGEIS